MASQEDLELDGDGPSRGKSSKDVRKNIPIKLKDGTAPKQRGRPRKVSKSTRSATKKREAPVKEVHKQAAPADDEMIEDMEFSTMKVTGDEPTHKTQKLKWNHKVNLIGFKVVDPIIHTCSTCLLPILIYGRMIPCKHVFCFDCAKKTDKACPRCSDPVTRVEQSALGAVFVCSYGGSKHGTSGCRRTYLSQRDLQAHVNYRHLKEQQAEQNKAGSAQQPPAQQGPPLGQPGPGQPPPAGQAPPTGPPVTPQVSPGPMYGVSLTSPPIAQTLPLVGAPPVQQGPPPQSGLDPGLMYHQQQPPPQQQQQGPPPQVTGGMPPQHTLPPPQQHSLPPPPLQPQGGPHPLPGAPLSGPPLTGPPLSGPPLSGAQGPPIAQNPPRGPPDTFHSIPVMSSRISNLITVPLQDESAADPYGRPRDQPITGLPPYATPNPGGYRPPQHYTTNPPPQGIMSNLPPFSSAPPRINLSQPPPPIVVHNNQPRPQGHNNQPRPQGHNNQPHPQGHNNQQRPQGLGNQGMSGQGHGNQGLNNQPAPGNHGNQPRPQGHNQAHPPLGNRGYPSPRPPSGGYGQPPPPTPGNNAPRPWQGGPPMGPGGPPQHPPPPTTSGNMGGPPGPNRQFY